MPDFLDLEDGEAQLDDPAELVWRQCAPGCYDEDTDKPSATMFRPHENDGNKLSGARSTRSTARAAYEHRTRVMKKESRGTWGVTVEEIETVESRAVDDSALLDPPPASPPGHTYFDLRHLAEAHAERQARERFRSRLLIFAHNRQRQYPPIDTSVRLNDSD